MTKRPDFKNFKERVLKNEKVKTEYESLRESFEDVIAYKKGEIELRTKEFEIKVDKTRIVDNMSIKIKSCDLKVGDIINDWTIIEEAVRVKAHYYIKCKCKCGTIRFSRRDHLHIYHYCSNCANKKRHIPKYSGGDVINGKTIISFLGRKYQYKCACGNISESRTEELENSPYCRKCKYMLRPNSKWGSAHKYGPHRKRKSSNVGHPLYSTWESIFQRCYNINHQAYYNYGGRGIKVHEHYYTFENFLADMDPKPGSKYSLDRIDPDGDYSPGNLRWATKKEQEGNKRNSKKNRDKYILVKRSDLCEKCLKKLTNNRVDQS